MQDVLKEIFEDMESRMESSVAALRKRLGGLRTGGASASLFDSISANFYGSSMPINQIASVTVPEPRSIVIQPWDAGAIDGIVNAILTADMGLNPIKDGGKIRVPIPELSEERRHEISKTAANYGEEAKVAVRNVRRDGMERIKKLETAKEISQDDKKVAEKRVQTITDESIALIAEVIEMKQKAVMKV